MASNALERAVIEAARAYSASRNVFKANVVASPWDAPGRALVGAIERLEAWERTQAPAAMEVGWHEVTEGDQLKSIKTGKFYPVTGTLKVKAGYAISVQGAPKPIIRPTAAEPTATVLRGPTGDAVDTFTHVFSSGGQ